MIAAGTSITFTVQGTTGFWPTTVASLRTTAIDALTPFMDVADVSIVTDTFLANPVTYLDSWPYKATVRATTRVAYAGIRDVDSVVAHAFYVAASELPTVTASGYEQGQSEPSKTTGITLTTALVLVAVALVAVAVFKVSN